MDLVRLIDHPELMNKETLYELRSLVALYPYYQTARVLMLKNMYLLHDTAFDDELRRAALYISDRRLLFNIVEGARYKIKTAAEKAAEKAAEEAVEKAAAAAARKENAENRTLSIIDNYLDSNPETDEEDSKVRPTPSDAAIDYVAYLMKTESKDEEEKQQQSPQLKGQDLIDNFLNQDGAKIQLQEQPTYKPEPQPMQDTPNDGDDSYFTETLAKIYIKQGRYSKALEIIQRLNLNYPKKNAYFADQIRFLQKLILNNKNNKQ